MNNIEKAYKAINEADAILIGASNGLSIAEGYHIFANNSMFKEQFGDMEKRYGFRNIIEGCFFRYPDMDSQNEFFRRLIQFWIKDYKPSKVMKDLLSIIGNKDYFIITSNGDTHLELSGFDKNKIFEIEGTFENKFEHVEDKNPLLSNFLNNYHGKKLVILELGIGIRNKLIKQPIMQLAAQEPQAKYITLNLAQEIYIPSEIAYKSIGLPGDIAETLNLLNSLC